jgi:tRNA (cytosine49-C5)-methyltransferase
MQFKDKFIEKYSKYTDIEKFKEYSLKKPRKSIRVNTLKISVKELKSRLSNFTLTQIPWCKEGFFIQGERTDLGNLLEHQLGYIYIQEASSMIPAQVLDPKDEVVLDMAAAPGSKTTHSASLMNNSGLIIANELKYDRIKSLSSNLTRCGVSNAVITNQDAINLKGTFDKILLDAPCSGTGTIRKSPNTIKIWNPNMYRKLSNLQKKLILHAYSLLNKNGTLVYSTCSISPEEDEEVIEFLLEKTDAKLEKINLNLKSSPCITQNKEVKKCLRIWPQDNNTDGFFIAKIRKL